MISFLIGNTFAAVGNRTQSAHSPYASRRSADEDKMVWIMKPTFLALHSSVKEIERVATEINLDASITGADDYINLMIRAIALEDHYMIAAPNAERLTWTLNSLVRIFTAQLQSRLVMVLDSRNARYVVDAEPRFGREVDDAFPKAAEELSEAAKCLAMQRNTACVFHLMRAMELAVARLSEAIKTGKSTDKQWGKILADLGQTIERMPKGAERNRWSESHTHLYHVKQAWRTIRCT